MKSQEHFLLILDTFYYLFYHVSDLNFTNIKMNKSTSLMLFNKNNILRYVPNVNAVFYLRGIADENSLYPIYYIGQGSHKNIKRKLMDLLEKENWTDVVYINYIECDHEKYAKSLEKYEINRHRPKYNYSPNVENIMHMSMYQAQR